MSLAFLEYEEQFGRLWHRLVGEPAELAALPGGRGGPGGRAAPARRPVPRHGRRSGARARGRRGPPRRGHRLRLAQRLGHGRGAAGPGRAHRRSWCCCRPCSTACPSRGAQPRPLCLARGLPRRRASRRAPAADPLRRDVARLRGVRPAHRRACCASSPACARATRAWRGRFWRCGRRAGCRRRRPAVEGVVRRPPWRPRRDRPDRRLWCLGPSGALGRLCRAARLPAASCRARSGARSASTLRPAATARDEVERGTGDGRDGRRSAIGARAGAEPEERRSAATR